MEGADFLKLEELILLAIAGKSEIYGLEIATDIAKASEDKVQLNYGSLYPYLNRLEKKGYISSRWEEENERKGARRKYYQTTSKGIQSLDDAKLIRQRLRQQNLDDTKLVRQRLRQQYDDPIIITSQIHTDRDVDKLLKILQHSEEKERIQAIYELKGVIKVNPELYWEITQALATFIRNNSPIDEKSSIALDIQVALNVMSKQEIDLDRRSKSRIDLHEANLTNANLSRANLGRYNFGGANFRGAFLEGANLREASLRESVLRLANLKTANLEGAYLEGADLEGANLEGANIRKANFGEANLMGVKNLTIAQLHFAYNWQQARNIPCHLKIE